MKKPIHEHDDALDAFRGRLGGVTFGTAIIALTCYLWWHVAQAIATPGNPFGDAYRQFSHYIAGGI